MALNQVSQILSEVQSRLAASPAVCDVVKIDDGIDFEDDQASMVLIRLPRTTMNRIAFGQMTNDYATHEANTNLVIDVLMRGVFGDNYLTLLDAKISEVYKRLQSNTANTILENIEVQDLTLEQDVQGEAIARASLGFNVTHYVSLNFE